MLRSLALATSVLVAGPGCAWALPHCQYTTTLFVFGQDSQGQIRAPAAVPCHIFFRTARGRTEWSIVQAPAHGKLTPVGDRGWDYVPSSGYAGPDAFVVEASGETMGRYVQSGSSKISFAVNVVP